MYHRPLDVNKKIHILSNNYIQTIIIIGWLIFTYNYNLIAENPFLFKPLLNLDLNYMPRECLTLSRFHNICILEILNWLILQLIKSLQIRMIKTTKYAIHARFIGTFFCVTSQDFMPLPLIYLPRPTRFFVVTVINTFFQRLAYKGERSACPPSHTLIFTRMTKVLDLHLELCMLRLVSFFYRILWERTNGDGILVCHSYL